MQQRRRRRRARQPQLRRRRHQRGRGELVAARRPPRADAEPLPHAAPGGVPLLRLDAARRRGSRHGGVLGGAGGAEGALPSPPALRGGAGA